MDHLSAKKGVSVVGEAGDGDEAVRLTLSRRPGVRTLVLLEDEPATPTRRGEALSPGSA